MNFRRPSQLVIIKEEKSDHACYRTHLATLPECWEVSGMRHVLKQLKKRSDRPAVHFCNVSSAKAINYLRKAKASGLNVTCDTAPHYLFFTSEDVKDGGTDFKDFPPIREPMNRGFLIELLTLGQIDVLSSHHAFVTPEVKFLATGNFKRAVPGVNCIENSLRAAWTTLAKYREFNQEVLELDLVRLAQIMCLNPAKVLGLADRYGSLEAGKVASFIVWKPFEKAFVNFMEFEFSRTNLYKGLWLFGAISAVYVRGQPAYVGGQQFPVGSRVRRAC